MSKRYCVLDFETTGLYASDHEVIEFAAVRLVDGQPDMQLASLCCPKGEIGSEITRLTGITPDMVRHKPPFEEVLGLLLDFIGTDTLVAHNMSFDASFLDAYCARAGLTCTAPRLCTLQLSRSLLRGVLPNHKLGTLAAHFEIPNPAAHRALGDALTTAQVLLKLLELQNARV